MRDPEPMSPLWEATVPLQGTHDEIFAATLIRQRILDALPDQMAKFWEETARRGVTLDPELIADLEAMPMNLARIPSARYWIDEVENLLTITFVNIV